MLLSVDHASKTPLYEQLADSLISAISAGDLRGGERLPSARMLAADLDVNMHTVLRAYGCLRDRGLVELRRGREAVVAGDAVAALPPAVRRALDRLVDVAASHGVGRDELATMLRAAP